MTGDFASELGHGVKTKHPLDKFVSGFVNKLIVHYILRWLDHCFETYNEGYFHLQMSQGFNFMKDMEINHKDWYTKFLRGARAMRNRYDVDQERILAAITKRVNDEGWSLYPQEITSIRAEIDALIKEIYN